MQEWRTSAHMKGDIWTGCKELPLWWGPVQERHLAAMRLLQESVERYQDACAAGQS